MHSNGQPVSGPSSRACIGGRTAGIVLAVVLAMAPVCLAKWEWKWGWPNLSFWDKDKPPANSTLYLAHPTKDSKGIYTSHSEAVKALIARMVEDSNATGSGPNLVVVTHGCPEKELWFKDLALATRDRVDPGQWLCSWYDWRGKTGKLSPTEASQMARQGEGPALGQEIVRLSKDWKHVHFIGHSAGCWLISEAAKVVAKETDASIQLTFLDAFVPPFWHEDELGVVVVDPKVSAWADHYFTSDSSSPVTDKSLTYAHNVDLTKVDPGPNSPRFPVPWYQATVVGRYTGKRYKDKPLYVTVGRLDYGYERSVEAGPTNWEYSLSLGVGNEPVVLIRDQNKDPDITTTTTTLP